MTQKDRTLSVTDIVKELDCVSSTGVVKGSGTIFHRAVEILHALLNNGDGLAQAVRSTPGNASQPLVDCMYDEILPTTGFHGLSDDAQEAVWTAMTLYLQEVSDMLIAAPNDVWEGKIGSSIFLGHELAMDWAVELGGVPMRIRGRLDALIQDPRRATPTLLDFKLCGVHKDLANFMQVMLYALMLKETRGIECGASVINLYPVRNSLNVTWKEISRFKPALLAFIQHIAANRFPEHVQAPERSPALTEELSAPLIETTPDKPMNAMDDPDMQRLINLLTSYGVRVRALEIAAGPRFKQLRIIPEGDTKATAILAREEDIKVHLNTQPHITIEPGYIGVQIPRSDPQIVDLVALLSCKEKQDVRIAAEFPVGVGTLGRQVWADLADHNQCHWLVAGTTGSGKSEFLRSVITSLGYKSDKTQVRFDLIDPKQGVTFAVFENSDLVDSLVITPEDAIVTLGRMREEMEIRYKTLRQLKLDNIKEWAQTHSSAPPRRVVIFDEFADFMLQEDFAKAILETCSALGAKGRACGIHLFLATQHPKAEIVPTEIRHNLPARAAFRAADKKHSQVMLDQSGAEKLLGKGDMLYRSAYEPERLQAPYADKASIRELMKIP